MSTVTSADLFALEKAKHLEKERDLTPVRIDRRTVILVTPDKLTPSYIQHKQIEFANSIGAPPTFPDLY